MNNFLHYWLSQSNQPRSTNVFQDRNYYGAVLEPKSGVLHGAGQHIWSTFEEYWQNVESKPCLYMSYIGLNDNIDQYIVDLQQQLDGKPGLGLQVGLAMTIDGQPEKHYEMQASNGELDDQLAKLLNFYQRLQRPVLLRIGYECNGTAWNGYEPDSFIDAFHYISEKVNEVNAAALEKGLEPNIARVWNLSMDYKDLNYGLQFKPDESHIDWWSINPFTTSDFEGNDLRRFLAMAHDIKKPVLLGEITPRYVGTSRGVKDWNCWFVRYFNAINDNPGVKASSYINWHWKEVAKQLGQVWGNWGDARVHNHPDILRLYNEEMSKPHWINLDG